MCKLTIKLKPSVLSILSKPHFFTSDIKWICIRVNKMIIMPIDTLINYGFELYLLTTAVQSLGSVKRGVNLKHKIG